MRQSKGSLVCGVDVEEGQAASDQRVTFRPVQADLRNDGSDT